MNQSNVEWESIVKPILDSDEFQIRKRFVHHDNSVYDHCMNVSYRSFLWAKKHHKNDQFIYNVTIAGLLHDFYPFPWQYSDDLLPLDSKYMTYLNKKHYYLFHKHGFVHAKEASINSILFYEPLINKKIINSIKRHMFPLNIIPPRYKEGWIVSLMDKKESFSKLPKIKELPKYIGLKTKK